MVKRTLFLVFMFYAVSSYALDNLRSNFILISNSSNKAVSADYRLPEDDSDSIFYSISKHLKGINPNLSPLFLFYTDDYADSPFTSRILVLDKNILFIYSEDKMLRRLGQSIDCKDSALIPYSNSIENSEAVAAYLGKSNTLVSIVIDKKGYVYSVGRDSSNGFTIETLGLSNAKISKKSKYSVVYIRLPKLIVYKAECFLFFTKKRALLGIKKSS